MYVYAFNLISYPVLFVLVRCPIYVIIYFLCVFFSSQGEVITFLDAHCECTEGWLEPLLARIVQNRRTVVCPIIDVISDESFEYITASDSTWGGFNWKLNFRW